MTDRTGPRPEAEVPGQELLRVTIGSHAHGTARPDSDIDQRVVFALPTTDFFQIGKKAHETVWVEGKLDLTGWEVGHYLKLATQCNPTILEVLWAPIVSSTHWGEQLRGLRQGLLDRKRIYESFSGYSSNQQKKMLGDIGSKEGITWTYRHWKFSMALLRVLQQGIHLLDNGELLINLSEGAPFDQAMHRILLECREGKLSPGDVIDEAHELRLQLFSAYNRSSLPVGPDLTDAQNLLNQVRTDMLL